MSKYGRSGRDIDQRHTKATEIHWETKYGKYGSCKEAKIYLYLFQLQVCFQQETTQRQFDCFKKLFAKRDPTVSSLCDCLILLLFVVQTVIAQLD